MHDTLPTGCLSRIVGPVEAGARIIEVWQSSGDAVRFSENYGHLIADFKDPPPTRLCTFRDD